MRTGVSGTMMVVALLVSGCSSGDGDSSGAGGGDDKTRDRRRAYVDAIAEETADSPFTAEENRCIAEAYVDAIGLDVIEDRVTPEELRDDPDSSLRDFGITPDAQQGEALFEGMQECADMRGLLVEQFVAQNQIPVELDVSCLEDEIGDDLLRSLMVKYLTEGGAAELGDQAGPAVQWVSRCADLRRALVTAVSEGASTPLDPETVTCVESQLDDDFVQRFWAAALAEADPEAFTNSPVAAELEPKLGPCLPTG